MYRCFQARWTGQGSEGSGTTTTTRPTARFPTLDDYVRHVIPRKYHTSDLDEAAARYVSQHVLPHLQLHDEVAHPLPRLLLEHRQRNPCFRVELEGDVPTRRPL